MPQLACVSLNLNKEEGPCGGVTQAYHPTAAAAEKAARDDGTQKGKDSGALAAAKYTCAKPCSDPPWHKVDVTFGMTQSFEVKNPAGVSLGHVGFCLGTWHLSLKCE